MWSVSNAGSLVFFDLLLRASVFILMFTLAVACAERHASAVFILAAALCLGSVSLQLYPLVSVTELCLSPRAGTRSIIRLAARFTNHEDMSFEAKAEHARFLQYLTTVATGIEIPFVGTVTIQALMTYSKVLVTLLPVAVTYTMRAVGRDIC
eukprot:TRINITY_DN20976_c0_g1_i2.p1 TRINITY_DN20976_c0_g1~~TRINITY_DN20976_c0_g1_i2.p1  ORF type:complete len:152 (+),score=20.52 TRINITY_DN20976_c0_g1_i2:291-746(+)